MICGKNEERKDNAVIVELKQWDKCEEAAGENEVMTWLGGTKREVLHPSVQVGQYQMYLEDTHTAFYEGPDPIALSACTYLHNYNFYSEDIIFSNKFKKALQKYPLFTADDVDKLKNYLASKLETGEGTDVLRRVEESKYRPSKKLMDHLGNMIKGKSEYILLDEQLVVYDAVLSCAKKGFHDKQKTVIIVKGGPGTGKSVIAINLMADLLLKGYNAQYATGSRAFTETLRKIIGTRGSVQFKYFNSYIQAENNIVDVLIADEAHRIRETSNDRFTPRIKKSEFTQVEELLHSSKVGVFLIDDKQVVRPNEIGSAKYIKQAAFMNKCKVFEYQLDAQFRCNGSDAFVNWINNTLGIERTAHVIWDQQEEFDFEIFQSPLDLENAIRRKVSEGFTGRVTAGFCWGWSSPNEDGTLKNDLIIGHYRRPWNAKPEAKKLARGIPKASLWAHDPSGINQVGCVYTAQGFEFDYVGIIFGDDLVYDFDRQSWVGNLSKSSDNVVKRSGEKFVDLVKNTYRVLLSRGMKGCYVYFMNKDTERFFKSRIENLEQTMREKELISADLLEQEMRKIYRILPNVEEYKKFTDYLPVYSLKAAAGYFGNGKAVEPEGWIQVAGFGRLDKRMFVARAVGRSMEPRILDGDLLLFRSHPVGSRQGKIVLVQYHEIADPETGGSYTVKRYQSEKSHSVEGDWKHTRITLEPLNPEFKPIIFESADEGSIQVVAEYLGKLGNK